MTPSLNIFERLWMAWYAFMQNDVLATGIMSFVMHELVYFGRSLPWFIMDRMPSMNKYKIQNVRICWLKTWILSSTDNLIAKDTYCSGTMELRKARPPQPLYCRTSSNLALPPYGPILWPRDWRTIPSSLQDGISDCSFLRS